MPNTLEIESKIVAKLVVSAPVLYGPDGEERELPFRWVICGECSGHGKSSAYLGAFTADQMCEDPEFADDYMTGRYDRTCGECDGRGSVKVVDEKAMTKADRKAWREQVEADREVREIEHQERLMEGGWRDMEAYGAGY